jgi:hypothetical protein
MKEMRIDCEDNLDVFYNTCAMDSLQRSVLCEHVHCVTNLATRVNKLRRDEFLDGCTVRCVRHNAQCYHDL